MSCVRHRDLTPGALLRATDAGRTRGHEVGFVRASDGPVERTLRVAGVDALLPLAA